jgi:hypothetical protein
MLLRPEYLSQELDRPLPTKDGGTLRTIRDACNYMTSMGKKRELRSHWQRACKLILAKEDVLTVSRALELALFMDAKLEVGGTRQGREAEQRPTRKREQNMAWIMSTVQSISAAGIVVVGSRPVARLHLQRSAWPGSAGFL